MSLIQQKIPSLLNGVSQRPQEQRQSSEAETQLNGLSHPVRGLMKRPPLTLIGKCATVSNDFSDAFLHSVNRDEIEKYHVIISNGDIHVFDALDGAELTVLDLTPNTQVSVSGDGYLFDNADAGFRAATAGDTTIVVNRGVQTSRGDTKTAKASFDSLIYIRQADYATTYSVTLNGTEVAIQTVAGATAASRIDISTDQIAQDLLEAMQAEAHFSNFTFTRFGSTISIVENNGIDYSLSVSDGLADKGLRAVKGSVQSFEDLPRKAPEGFTIEVAGDINSDSDNYWVFFDTSKSTPELTGVWRECPAPGTLVDLDAATMPHRLVRQGTVLGDIVHTGLQSSFGVAVVDGNTTSELAWELLEPSNVSAPAPPTTITLRDNGEGVEFTVSGTYPRIFFPFSVDLSLVDTGNTVTVSLWKNGVEIQSRAFTPGSLFGRGFFIVDSTVSVAAGEPGDVFLMQLNYDFGDMSGSPFHRASLVPQQPVGIALPVLRIVFDSTITYSSGTIILVTVDGTQHTYVVGASDQTADEVAAGVASLLTSVSSAQLDVSNPNAPSPYVNISRDDALIPAVSAEIDLSDNKRFSNPTLELVPNAFAGLILKNVTDGSEGIIASNTATTITLEGQGPSFDIFLSGGVDNVFNLGDICEVVGTGRYFVWEQCPWKDRGAGDLAVCPFPSFIDKTINDVAFYQNRLVLASNENLIFSVVGDLFNFFRFSAAQLLADDPIDVKAAHREVALFHSLAMWNESLYAISESGPFLVGGSPLTATSITIDFAGHVPNNKTGARPLAQGNRLYLTRTKGGFTQVPELYASDSTTALLNQNDLNIDTPKYLSGAPHGLVGDDGLGLLFVLTDEGRTIYVYKYAIDSNGNRVQHSWSQWQIWPNATIVGFDLVDGKLAVFVQDTDGFYLYECDINVVLTSFTDVDESVTYLDRRVGNGVSGFTATDVGNDTQITLPYSVKTNGTDGTVQVVDRTNGQVYTPVNSGTPSTTITVSNTHLAGHNLYVGVLYEFRYVLSRFFWRNPDGIPEVGGRLGLRYLDVYFHDTTDFVLRVTRSGTVKDVTVQNPASSTGQRRFAIMGRNRDVTLELRSLSSGTCAFVGLDWEGDFTLRSRRV